MHVPRGLRPCYQLNNSCALVSAVIILCELLLFQDFLCKKVGYLYKFKVL